MQNIASKWLCCVKFAFSLNFVLRLSFLLTLYFTVYFTVLIALLMFYVSRGNFVDTHLWLRICLGMGTHSPMGKGSLFLPSRPEWHSAYYISPASDRSWWSVYGHPHQEGGNLWLWQSSAQGESFVWAPFSAYIHSSLLKLNVELPLWDPLWNGQPYIRALRPLAYVIY